MAEQTQQDQAEANKLIPVHQWTHTGSKVRILKCVKQDGTSYGGFKWPEKGPVNPGDCSREPTCESGGAFGWPWGIYFGDGKEPGYRGKWIVFEADPRDVIDLGGKVKAVPDPESGRVPEVIYCGSISGATTLIAAGRHAWIWHASSSGEKGNASSSGEKGNASSSGEKGNASSSGYLGNASSSGEKGNASSSGYLGNASSSGTLGNASSSGTFGNASSSGDKGNASSSGEKGNASSSGERGVAALSGERGSVKAGATGLAVATADDCYWHVVDGCVFVQRWRDGYKVLTAEQAQAKTGDKLRIVRGEIVERVVATTTTRG